jgi:hypothetical protein
LLDFLKLEGRHSGENIAERIFEVLDKYLIAEKLFCITTDNASNNIKCMRHLSRILKDRKGVKWDYRKLHISCLNHVINIGFIDTHCFMAANGIFIMVNYTNLLESRENSVSGTSEGSGSSSSSESTPLPTTSNSSGPEPCQMAAKNSIKGKGKSKVQETKTRHLKAMARKRMDLYGPKYQPLKKGRKFSQQSMSAFCLIMMS